VFAKRSWTGPWTVDRLPSSEGSILSTGQPGQTEGALDGGEMACVKGPSGDWAPVKRVSVLSDLYFDHALAVHRDRAVVLVGDHGAEAVHQVDMAASEPVVLAVLDELY
jgi:hypothetical protein